eukprot:350953-Chlamydomonas_euryale.AAC.2
MDTTSLWDGHNQPLGWTQPASVHNRVPAGGFLAMHLVGGAGQVARCCTRCGVLHKGRGVAPGAGMHQCGIAPGVSTRVGCCTMEGGATANPTVTRATAVILATAVTRATAVIRATAVSRATAVARVTAVTLAAPHLSDDSCAVRRCSLCVRMQVARG